MAKSKDNVVMQGASGTIGRMLVFRQRAGQTIIARRPVKKEGKMYTADQIKAQERFSDAAYYAKSAIKDEDLRAAYEAVAKPGQSAYNVAFKDFLKAPVVNRVFMDNYQGTIDDVIGFRIVDVLEVKSVNVEIKDQDGNLIEEGAAVKQFDDGIDWIYTATEENEDWQTSQLTLTIVDTPGNVYKVVEG